MVKFLYQSCYILVILLTSFNHVFGAELEPIEIDSTSGRRLLNLLQSANVIKDTTSARVEKKTVITESFLQEQLENLSKSFILRKKNLWSAGVQGQIEFTARDLPPAGGANMTFTFYGRGMFFKNFGVKTKIKLRARFYLQTFNNGRELQRSPTMQDYAYLELKVKNPAPHLLNSVEKYRVKIRDTDLLRLYQLDPDSPHFVEDLEVIRQGLLDFAGQRKKNSKLVHAIIAVVAELSRKNTHFIRPAFAISYLREAAKYVEPLSASWFKSKTMSSKDSRTQQTSREGKGSGQSKSDKREVEGVEYQLTLDRSVCGYIPHLPTSLENIESFSFLEYFHSQAPSDLRVSYPASAVVIELKIPIEIAKREKNKRTSVQDHIATVFSEPTFDSQSVFPGFIVDKGKASFIRRALLEDRR